MNNRQNLFGSRGGREDGGYGRPPQPPTRDIRDTQMGGYGSPQPPPRQQAMPQRTSVGRSQPGDRKQLRIAKVEDKTLGTQYIFGNICAVSPQDFPPSRDGADLHILLNGLNVVMARPTQMFPPGCISLSDPQRSWVDVGMMDPVVAELYDPFEGGRKRDAYLGALDLDIAFATLAKTTDEPYDQDALADKFNMQFDNQVLAPGQKILMDYKNIPLLFTVKTVQLTDLSMSPKSSKKPEASPMIRGILMKLTRVTFYKEAKSKVKLQSSAKRPSANPILSPDFNFADMGIGGLDDEFSTIFRRAFASRLMPVGLLQKMGIQHVKGILLYGPPGTGKTLMARQIGKMLNAREPKVINGPEVLNKFVGQSEENVRKLFIEAEKEYKEKGDESGLHIIIFDELDAVCKQRGSTGGGTGVGDSVVNQLLSKLDGVDQLNNILLIGMTNRKDMIDDALLRPGRLEVHMEISLPDIAGRRQILQIHTAKLLANNIINEDVDVLELAELTKNFSGAEIGGLVKSASSYAFNRSVKIGGGDGATDGIQSMANITEGLQNLTVNRDDFMKAFDDVKPAYGVSEEELENAVRSGILYFSPHIQQILKDGQGWAKFVKESDSHNLASVLLYGPPGAGKTALAATIAKKSEFPFIKLITAENMTGFSDNERVQYINRTFTDAYKSSLSVIVIDNIERIIEWSPIGQRYSNQVLQLIMVLLAKKPVKNRRLLILATTSNRSLLRQLDMQQIFSREIPVPAVNTMDELRSVLRADSAFGYEALQDQCLNELIDTTGTDKVGVGIKRVLEAVREASLEVNNVTSRFAEIVAQQMISIQTG